VRMSSADCLWAVPVTRSETRSWRTYPAQGDPIVFAAIFGTL
jgi:hypothetical protein